MGQTEGHCQFPLGHVLGQESLITAEHEILLDKLAQKIFSLDHPHKGPESVASPRIARVQKAYLTLPFWIEEIVIGPKLLSLYKLRVVPYILGDICLKAVNITLSGVDPHMPAPPLLRVLYLGQYK